MKKDLYTINLVENDSPINKEELEENFSKLRDKLWRADKIKIQGYTYSEWKRSLN